MAAYEESTAALSAALKDPRLSHERIAETTDALAEALADQEEIDAAVRGVGRVDVDDDELAEELEALVLQEKQEREEREAKQERERELAAREAAKEAAKAQAQAQAERVQAAPKVPVAAAEPTDEWAARHAAAQQRQAEEKQRAETERLAKENQYLPAE